MTELAARIENLSKRYDIKERVPYRMLRESLSASVKGIFHHNGDGTLDNDRYIWALRNISFDVKVGEIIGIIGRNGAGKSTLLKILSRVTEPTEGYAEIRGRVGSLLEVGTGFHMELTGRENVYFAGALLGMKKTEILQKFSEIIKFAELEKFIDTPMKYYSSGMQVRLGFSVAAHLEPEVLIVDEVLAVGDAAFQKRCLEKIQEIHRSGRTLLFVSHQMDAVRRVCKHCIWLDAGKIRMTGNTEHVVREYISTTTGKSPGDDEKRSLQPSKPVHYHAA
jgi:lipopolysaccharide transport system ATP-binding protein